MPLPKKHPTLDVVKKIKTVNDNVLEQKDFIPMVLTTEMKLNKKKKNNMNAYQYTDEPIQMASINDFRN